MKYLALPRRLTLPQATLYIQQNGNLLLVINEGSKTTDLPWLIFNKKKNILDISLIHCNVFWKASISINEYFEIILKLLTECFTNKLQWK